jgi:polar amino acid transport system substrate-binding protein
MIEGEQLMKRSAVSLFITLMLILCFAAVASAGPTIDGILKKKVLVVGTSASYPPLSFKTKSGKVLGLDMDLAQAMASAMGVKLKIEVIPFDELIPALEKGKIDMIMSCMTITPDRNLRIAYVGPYFLSGQAILTTKDIALNINGPADVNNQNFSIALPRGTTTEMIAKKMLPQAKLVIVKSNDEALDLLKAKTVKAIMSDYPYVVVEAFRYKDKGFVANQPFSAEPIGIGVRQDDPLLINWIGNFLNMLKGDGLLNLLTQRWMADSSWIAELP